MDTIIRPAEPADIPAILEMIRELAEFEKLSDQVVATEADYEKNLFGENPAAEALIAETENGDAVGYAIFFSTFSTFLGKAGLWLEDLYVRPDFRGSGVGKRLLRCGAEMASERGAGRYEWCVLDWNKNAIDFYENAGADILQEWRIVRLEKEGIEKLTKSSS